LVSSVDILIEVIVLFTCKYIYIGGDEVLKKREQVKKIFSKNQWKAFKTLFSFNSKVQDTSTQKKFAPHSERQIAEFFDIFKTYGYLGEILIGNNYWMSVILSHHNSISTIYNKKELLYPNLKPKLMDALKNDEI
jgi:hypothetical protein